jgi:hypothetical protein
MAPTNWQIDKHTDIPPITTPIIYELSSTFEFTLNRFGDFYFLLLEDLLDGGSLTFQSWRSVLWEFY